MAGRKLLFAVVATAFIAAGAGAHAETKGSPADNFTVNDSFASDANQWSPQIGRRSLQWDSKKAKWGLKLDMDQQLGLPLPPQTYNNRQVQAGAFFKITPSFRVGGSVRVGALNDGPQPVIPSDTSPKVRLETALKF